MGPNLSISSRAIPVARMPVERNASAYNMNHPKRGMAIIFNHGQFDNAKLGKRLGTQADCDNLNRTLKRLHFATEICQDFTWAQIRSKIQEGKRNKMKICCLSSFFKLKIVMIYTYIVSKCDHNENDCLLITILTHGKPAGNLYAKDKKYCFEEIWKPFAADMCPTLAGKPKLFFIQACRGVKLDGGIELRRTVETDAFTSTDELMNYKIPVCADFLTAYSTTSGADCTIVL